MWTRQSAKASAVLFLALAFHACSSVALPGQKAMSDYPDFPLEAQPVDGEAYHFDGIYYGEWEEEGLIPDSQVYRDYFSIQKSGMFCVGFEPHAALPRGCARGVLPGVQAARIRVIATFFEKQLPLSVRSREFGCPQGGLLVNRVLSCKKAKVVD